MRALLVPLLLSSSLLTARTQTATTSENGLAGPKALAGPESVDGGPATSAKASTGANGVVGGTTGSNASNGAPGSGNAPAAPANQAASATPTSEGTAETKPLLELQPGAAHPGDLVMITLNVPPPCPAMSLGDRALNVYEMPGACRAMVGLTVEQPAGPLDVRVNRQVTPATDGAPAVGAGKVEVLGTLEVLPPAFNVRELHVANKFVKPSAAQKKKMKEDQRAFDNAFSQPFGPPVFTQDFARPLDSVVTAPFGDLRTFNGKKQSQHYGMDLDGRIGDPIHASNDGIVVMARENFASGNTVILSHGAGLYTSYFHMTRMDVKVGQKVKQGEQLGIVGKTGRVTGPHLHFGCKVTGMWVDPASLLAKRFGTDSASAQQPGTGGSETTPPAR